METLSGPNLAHYYGLILQYTFFSKRKLPPAIAERCPSCKNMGDYLNGLSQPISSLPHPFIRQADTSLMETVQQPLLLLRCFSTQSHAYTHIT